MRVRLPLDSSFSTLLCSRFLHGKLLGTTRSSILTGRFPSFPHGRLSGINEALQAQLPPVTSDENKLLSSAERTSARSSQNQIRFGLIQASIRFQFRVRHQAAHPCDYEPKLMCEDKAISSSGHVTACAVPLQLFN